MTALPVTRENRCRGTRSGFQMSRSLPNCCRGWAGSGPKSRLRISRERTQHAVPMSRPTTAPLSQTACHRNLFPILTTRSHAHKTLQTVVRPYATCPPKHTPLFCLLPASIVTTLQRRTLNRLRTGYVYTHLGQRQSLFGHEGGTGKAIRRSRWQGPPGQESDRSRGRRASTASLTARRWVGL